MRHRTRRHLRQQDRLHRHAEQGEAQLIGQEARAGTWTCDRCTRQIDPARPFVIDVRTTTKRAWHLEHYPRQVQPVEPLPVSGAEPADASRATARFTLDGAQAFPGVHDPDELWNGGMRP